MKAMNEHHTGAISWICRRNNFIFNLLSLNAFKKKKKRVECWQSLNFVAGVNLFEDQAIKTQNDIWPCFFIPNINKFFIVPSLSLKKRKFFQNTLNKNQQQAKIQFMVHIKIFP